MTPGLQNPEQIYQLEAGSKVLELSYRNGKINLLDSKFNLHKFIFDGGNQVKEKEVEVLAQNNPLQLEIQKGQQMKVWRMNSRALTTAG